MKTGVALLLLALAFRLSSAADAEGWKSQILYFAITDRFAQAPGVKPLGPCKLTGWNNGKRKRYPQQCMMGRPCSAGLVNAIQNSSNNFPSPRVPLSASKTQ